MKSHLLACLLVLYLTQLAQPHSPPYPPIVPPSPICPSSNSYLSFHTNHIQISATGLIPLLPNTESQCYNYTLPKSFQSKYDIAISVSHFESHHSHDLYFSITAIKTDMLTVIPFLVRLQHKYTQWIKFEFQFIAESQNNIQVNFYSVDTSSLAGCSNQKSVRVILPFKNTNWLPTKAFVFLNGFEISTQFAGTQSPYQVQLNDLALNNTGISISVTITSLTKVYSVYISFVAYDASFQNLNSGSYLYQQFTSTNQLSTNFPFQATPHRWVFEGISGFIIANNNFKVMFSSLLQLNTLSFTASSTFMYLSYNYIFMLGGPCSDCLGYPIYHNGACVISCPAGSYRSGNDCITCTGGQIWNPTNSTCYCPQGTQWTGVICQTICLGGQIYNSQLQRCECPSGSQWNGQSCVTIPQCYGGQLYNSATQKCQCPTGSQWNGQSCVTIPQCYGGQVYNHHTHKCQCPSGSQWNGNSCVTIPQCYGGQIYNPQTRQCQCPSGSQWNGQSCVTIPQCYGGQVYNTVTKQCQCPSGSQWNGQSCTTIPQCTGGQIYNPHTRQCECPSGSQWNGQSCISLPPQCPNGQLFNPQTRQCECPPGTHWNQYQCITCPHNQPWNNQKNICECPYNQYWNGFSCITCNGGKIWCQQSHGCICPNGTHWNQQSCISCHSGQYWNGQQCIRCLGGQVWYPFDSTCKCPTGRQWNGQTCIVPCPPGQISTNGICSCPPNQYMVNGVCRSRPDCPPGTTWFGHECKPIICPPGHYWKDNKCVIITPDCPAGSYWDGLRCTSVCHNCPPGTSWNGTMCITDAKCPPGNYYDGQNCVPLSCICPPGMNWVNGQCLAAGNNCPPGTFFNGMLCLPIDPCSNGRIWNSKFSQCLCPSSTFWNGQMCISCLPGQIYGGQNGCFCPIGYFFNGTKCTKTIQGQCSHIDNSFWNGTHCVCHPGYYSEGMKCICDGLALPKRCDRCYQKPNSVYKYGICQCKKGFYDIQGQCKPIKPPVRPPKQRICNVGTYFDNNQKQCLPCSDGCLSCFTCYECKQCRPGYTFDPTSKLCKEICGDGKRFTLQCDDNNNNATDGCSPDCKIEVGYHCVGGSPNSKDMCSATKPQKVIYKMTGQTHLKGKIIINVKINYMPLDLLRSATDCKNNCEHVLFAKITSGDKGATSIKPSYIETSSYSFSIVFEYGRQPIGPFKIKVGIKKGIAVKYYAGINAKEYLKESINPAFLAVVQQPNTLV